MKEIDISPEATRFFEKLSTHIYARKKAANARKNSASDEETDRLEELLEKVGHLAYHGRMIPHRPNSFVV